MAEPKSSPDIPQDSEKQDDGMAANPENTQQHAEDGDKVLPSTRGKAAESQSEKTLPSASGSAPAGEKILPSTGAGQTESPPASTDQSPPAVSGYTLKERIHLATQQGGLQKLPPGFDDEKGDWQCIKSDNVFERLYLDHTLYEQITPAMVEQHYQIFNTFWQEKIALMSQGANRIVFEKKFGHEIRDYTRRLALAYKQLMAPDGIAESFRRLDAERLQRGRERLEPRILEALDDKILEPAEANMLKMFGRSETDLTDNEIEALIKDLMAETGSIEGQGGTDISESERLFFHQIKKFMRDRFLSNEEENELAEDAPTYNIPESRMNNLILQALREIDGSERESTIEQDKENFREYYYGLLRDHGLEDDDKLPKPAREKLLTRDNSETDFFPLSQQSRTELVHATIEQYKKDLADEKERFYQDALDKLAVFAQHDYGRQALTADDAYKLLLPDMRGELIETAIQEITANQSEQLTQAAKSFYHIKHWHISDDDRKAFIEDPNRPFSEERVRCDWLREDARKEIFEQVVVWADKEYDRERKEIRATIEKHLQEYSYGLPLPLQEEIEKDAALHLSRDERREILIELEKEHRQKAEDEFTELVKSNIVFETLIPDREKALLKEGRIKYVLNAEKVEKSQPVKTAEMIISESRKPFKDVVEQQVADLVNKYQMDDEIVKQYELPHNAYMSMNDVNSTINAFRPEDDKERNTVARAFKGAANKSGLYIIEKNQAAEFSALLHEAMEKASHGYKYGRKRWLSENFRNNMLKVGAAFGVDKKSVELKLNVLKDEYSDWTMPKWGRLSLVFFGGALIFLLLRFFISLTGYDDWIMASGPVHTYERAEYHSLLTYDHAKYYASGWPDFASFFVIALSIIFLAHLARKRQGDNIGWGAVLLAVIVASISSSLVSAGAVFVFGNAGLLAANFGIVSWYLLQNGWAYTVKFISGLDYLLCGLPMRPEIAWTALGASLGLVAGIFYSTRGLRRSYLRLNAGLVGIFVVASIMVFLFSKTAIEDYEQRLAALVDSEAIATVQKPEYATVRSAPLFSALTLAQLPFGKQVVVHEQDDDWFKVEVNRFRETLSGYVQRQAFVRQDETASDFAPAGSIQPKQGGIVREGASISHKRIAALPHMARVHILGKKSDWYQIRYRIGADSATGYVHASVLQIEAETEIPTLPGKTIVASTEISTVASEKMQIEDDAQPILRRSGETADTLALGSSSPDSTAHTLKSDTSTRGRMAADVQDSAAATRKADERKKSVTKTEVEDVGKQTPVTSREKFSLRKQSRILSNADVKAIIEKFDFYCGEFIWTQEYMNPSGKGVANQFRLQKNGKVVYDAATGLTWQQSGSAEAMDYIDGMRYIDKLNRESFAGYNDWRLPTLEEALSLMEPVKSGKGVYINEAFDKMQAWIWTSDMFQTSFIWVTRFAGGNCDRNDRAGNFYVRAVR